MTRVVDTIIFWGSIVVKTLKQSRFAILLYSFLGMLGQYQRKDVTIQGLKKTVIFDNVSYNKIKNVCLDMNIGIKIKNNSKNIVKKGFVYSKAYQNFLSSEQVM